MGQWNNEFKMIKRRFYTFFSILLIAFAPQILMAQTADVTAGCQPLRVNFTPPEGATSFFWDFKDGGTSTLENPSNVFVNPGTFEVDFSSSQGGAVVGTITITVAARPTVQIEAIPASGCSPLDVEFRNITELPDGVEVTNAQWVFDDGTQATGNTVNKTYPTEGTFSVSLALTTTSDNCNATDQFVDVVEVATGPAVRFVTTPNPAASCTAPLTVSFSNQTPGIDNLTFEWDFGNGNTSTEVNPPAQSYTEDGDFEVVLSATDPILGCTKTFSQIVSIGSPTASFEVDGAACVNGPVRFTNNSSAGTYVWDIVGLTSSTDANPEINFPAPGDYQVRLIVTSPGGCSTDTTQTITVDQADASFLADPTFGCSEPYTVVFTPNTIRADATYEWEFGDDSTSTVPSLTHDYFVENESPYHENGEFDFVPTLTVTTESGCVDSSSTDLLLDIPRARFMPDTVSGCAPLIVEFSDSTRSNRTVLNWEWIYDNGQTNNFSTADAHNFTFTEPGEYDVQLVITNDLGCQDSSYTIRVEVGSRITPDFTTDRTEVCPGELVQFNDVTGSDLIDEWHYYTDGDRSSHCFDDANPSIPFETVAGDFGVTMVVGYNGCLDSISREDFLSVKGPIADIAYTIPCATPTEVSFTNASSDATTVSWNFGDGGEMSMEDNPSHIYEVGDYEVILTAENAASGCAPSIDTALVNIRNLISIGEVEFQQCRNQPVNLDGSLAEGVDTTCLRGYTWHFGHPALRPLTINEPTNMEISYPDTGFYEILLVVEDVNGCVDTSSYPVRVDEAIADFTMDKSVICFPMSVRFTDNSSSTAGEIETYMWDFGDGVGMQETQNAAYTYGTNPGGNSITVSLMVEDEVGCPGEATMTIETYQPTSTITTDPFRPNICAGETVNFSATDFTERGSNLSYSWDLGNGAGAATQSTSTTYNEGGTFNVVLSFTEIATGCPGQAITTVNAQDFPVASFASDVDGQNPICHPRNITFTNTSETTSDLTSTWNFGNGSAGVGNAAASFYPKGIYTVTLNTQTSFGCADQTTREFNLIGPEGEIEFIGGPFCRGDEVTATLADLEEVANYSWFFEGREFGANEPAVSFTVTEVPPNGQAPLTLELVGPEGCTFARQTNVRVTQVVAGFVTNADPCSPDVTFTNQSIGGSTFSWDFGDGVTSTSNSPTNSYGTDGTFDVTLQVTDAASGCTDVITQSVTVSDPTPVVARSLDTCIIAGSSASLPIVNNSNSALLLFDNQIGIECPTGGALSNCTTPAVTATTDVSYTLTIQDACFGTQTFDYNIGVFDPNRSLLPNAFTPDGDGTNDFFNVILSETGCSQVTDVLSFQVFDRWGTKVYDNDTPTQGWNGLYKGERQNPDVYIYAIEVRLNDGTETSLSGDVTLIR